MMQPQIIHDKTDTPQTSYFQNSKKLILCTSGNHKKTNIVTISFEFKLICKNSFSISLITATLKTLNLNKILNSSAVNDGPGYKHSFNDFLHPVLELAS